MNYMDRYLQQKLEAEKNLALNAEHTGKALSDIAKDTVETIEVGAKRLIWRTSVFFEGYEDVNEKINVEDTRMAKNIWRVVKEGNAIFRITELYVNEILKNRDFDVVYKILLKHTSKFIFNGVTKTAIAYSIAKILSEQLYFNMVVRRRLQSFSNMSIFAFTLYGNVEHAAVSADRLKREFPEFYWVLYSERLEMVYFVVEPAFSKHINRIKKIGTDEEAALTLLDLSNGD
ncbi:hypothetical protein [Dickeya sp. NCPPB 3274]|uniref:hypothetical protein n=1 Tax=Dickeya sp. NCPPB 3274 TaxID=568766 RepID=UPI0005B4509E|nr:hypothetical protein [Dickeya sp. NCPPB 3274]